VLVRVRAATARWTLDIPAGLRYLGRLAGGLRGPRNDVPGSEMAGQVQAVGRNAKQFQPGDEVFGWCKGALAEYVSVPEDHLAPKPANLTFEQAAVVPLSGFTALQGLRDKGQIRPGLKVLIVGASGGVGTFAVQIAKSFGADVTGVCSTPNLDLVRSIGADQVIDYTQEDFTKTGQHYDLILDLAGDRSLSDYRRALSPEGTLVMVGSAGSTSSHLYLRGFGRWLHALVLSAFVRPQRLRSLISTRSKADLLAVGELIEAGKLTPVISARYPLSKVPEAMRHFEEGHARGKVVIIV
jgi:NADPH:quinone reductase-like Zn-dependent oxidoreductase